MTIFSNTVGIDIRHIFDINLYRYWNNIERDVFILFLLMFIKVKFEVNFERRILFDTGKMSRVS